MVSRGIALRATALLLCVPVTSPSLAAEATRGPATDVVGSHILVGWNDLGMHCSNKNFADLAVLPPYNTFWSVLIQRGSHTTAPQVLGSPYTVHYILENNTFSVGKTDFWSYEDRLFGVQLPDNVGLTGNGLAGMMAPQGSHFVATGVPITPFDDGNLTREQPYQLARLQARDSQGTLLAETEIVTPVSNEMMCSHCHHPNTGETVELAILRKHDQENGTLLAANRPVLCARCHASNALGMPGTPGLPSLSQAMHAAHGEVTNNCYECHPGPNTLCLRDVMSQQHSMTCQNCHGSVVDVARSIENGRQPWLQEPRCGTCHGAAYSEAPNTLYRNSSNGHGGLFCATCHGSPHAILPSREERDNRQTIALQGYAGTLKQCDVCHGFVPSGPGPHGLYPTGVREPLAGGTPAAKVLASPNPMTTSTELHYRVVDTTPVRLAIYDVSGRVVKVLTARSQTPGDHTLVWNGTDAQARRVPLGVYFCKLETGGRSASTRIVLAAH